MLSVSAGAGHVRAAEAIAAYAAFHEAKIEAVHLDAMDFVPFIYRKLYTDGYLRLASRFPALWRALYHFTNTSERSRMPHKLRRFADRVSAGSLLRKIAELQPDAIICTHFLPAEILAHAPPSAGLRVPRVPVWVQVTDFDLHRFWIQPGMAGYFAASREIAYRMMAEGIAADRIHVTGIPIMPAFARPFDRQACRRKLGLDARRKTLLLMGGSAGVGSLDEIAERLLAHFNDLQIIAVAGKNHEALRKLRKLQCDVPLRLHVIGYADKIEELMACADFAVTKPGGLTVSECLAMELPMILHGPIPGQEERNADYLAEEGVALKACDAVTLEYRVQYLLENPGKLADMRRLARQHSRPLAARRVLDAVTQ